MESTSGSILADITPDTVYKSFVGKDPDFQCQFSDLSAADQERLVPLLSPATNQRAFYFLPATVEEVHQAVETAQEKYAAAKEGRGGVVEPAE